jgi:predicted DNA-binding antitoxin AbrB/MazE fold protein
MTTTVTATFANGVLTPDQPLPLGEQERVRLTIEPLEVWSEEKAQAAWEDLQRMIQDKPLHFGGEKFTRDELYDRN